MDPGKFKHTIENLRVKFDTIDTYYRSTVLPLLSQQAYVGRTDVPRIIRGIDLFKAQIMQIFDQLQPYHLNPANALKVVVVLPRTVQTPEIRYVFTNKASLIGWLRGRIMNYSATILNYAHAVGLSPEFPMVGRRPGTMPLLQNIFSRLRRSAF